MRQPGKDIANSTTCHKLSFLDSAQPPVMQKKFRTADGFRQTIISKQCAIHAAILRLQGGDPSAPFTAPAPFPAPGPRPCHAAADYDMAIWSDGADAVVRRRACCKTEAITAGAAGTMIADLERGFHRDISACSIVLQGRAMAAPSTRFSRRMRQTIKSLFNLLLLMRNANGYVLLDKTATCLLTITMQLIGRR